MKKIIGTALISILTIAWLVFTSMHFHGLNSIRSITDYRHGLLYLESLPADSLTSIPNAECKANIYIDSLCIPHIFSQDDNSLAYSIGYMHARDRYFQMEMLTHVVMGRLSEIIGRDGLNSDKMWRSFEIEEKGISEMDSLSKVQPDLVSYLNAYTRGINDYIQTEDKKHRDPLYLLWNYSPGIWKPYYSLLVQWYMSFDLTFNNSAPNKQEILDKLPENVRKTLYPNAPVNQPMIMPSPDRKQINEQGQPRLASFFKPGQSNSYEEYPANKSLGSNNWVVGPGRTEAGQIFLCNDLHLFLTNPNVFYELEMYSPYRHEYGYTIPGVPLIITGHNEKIAWGITNGGWDVTEQYVLKIDPENSKKYWLDGKWDTLITRSFLINIKDQQPENYPVTYSVFGWITKRDSFTYACRWHPSLWNAAIRSFWKLSQAGGWDDFKESLKYYDYPAQNFAYADVKGNIGMMSVGKMPVKPAQYAGGLLDGTQSPALTYIPFDSLPKAYNPSEGYLFSANQEPSRDGHYYSSDWFDDLYRPRRINDILLAKSKNVSKEDMRKMQMDDIDLSSKDIQDLLRKYTNPAQLSANWKSMLDWNGELTPGTREAVFFKAFKSAVNQTSRDIADTLKVNRHPGYDQFMNFLLQDNSFSYAGKLFRGRNFFKIVMDRTDSIFSGSRKNEYSFSIPQMTFLPGFDIDVDNLGGDENTINVNYTMAHPVIRTLIELKDGEIHSWMINAIAQSGRINDKNYTQQLIDWEQNKLHAAQFVQNPGLLKGVQSIISFGK